MLKTHNYFLDSLLSMRYLFDNIIFGPGLIKNYEFNLGNRTFQLQYKTQYELPMALISYQDSHAVNYKPWLILRSTVENNSTFPVLYNRTKDLRLFLQEDEYELTINVSINCESQLGALELQHQILNHMPIGKPLLIYNYYSFFEIEEQYLNPDMFDVNNDDIVNLHMKYNPLTDKPTYCYAVRYEPLIRMDGCSLSIGNSEPRSFPISCDFTVDLPMPIYTYIPDDELPKTDEVKLIKQKNIAFSVQEDMPLIKINSDNQILVIPLSIDKDKVIGNLKTKDNQFIINGQYHGVKIYGNSIVNFGKEDIQTDYILSNIDDIQSFVFQGPVVGHLNLQEYTSENIRGSFFGQHNGHSYNRPICCTNKILTKNWLIDHISLNSNLDFKYDIVEYGQPKDTIISINPKIVEFIPTDSKITSVIITENDTKVSHNISSDVSFDRYGNFTAAVDHNHSVTNQKIISSIQGKIHPNTLELEITYIEEQSQTDITINGVLCDMVFKTGPRYGARIINKISLDITPDSLEPISPGISSSFFMNEFGRLSVDNNKKLLRSLINIPRLCQDGTTSTIFREQNNKIIIQIELDQAFDFDTIYETKSIYWSFIFEDNIWDSDSSYVELVPRTANSIHNIIEFYIHSGLYSDTLINYSMSNPIIFQIFELM